MAIEHGEAFSVRGNVSWLLHIIHASIAMKDTKPNFKLRIFGYVFFDSLKPKPPKTKKKKKKKKKNKKRTKKNKKTNDLTNSKLIKDKTEDEVKQIEINQIESRQAESKSAEFKQKESISAESIPMEYQLNESGQKKVNQDELKEIAMKQQVDKEVNRMKDSSDNEDADKQSTGTTEQSPFQKVLSKILNIKEKIVEFFKITKEKIASIFQNLTDVQRKIGLISAFISDEMNRAGMKRTFKSIKKIVKHILPTKLKSKVIFGTGDPCSTGQLLGLCAILYSFYGDNMQITPDFQNARFEGQHYAKGRIRLITLLFIVIKLILDKRFKQLKGNLLILKEAL
ncbi:MAG: DUF2953 domain-containing protein [Mobilitalea sp.]